MIRKASLDGLVHGYRVCRQAPPVSHLLFADDSIFFFKASFEEARQMKVIFDAYSRASGQLINFDKSGIFFNKDLDTMLKNRSVAFQSVHDRMWQKLQSWQGKKLSRGGNEVLLKAVAQALPAYCMNVFLLPDLLTEDLERMMNSFWWGSKRMTGKGVPWMSWERMTTRKEHGGLGFRDIRSFNLALLGKQVWRLLSQPNSIVSRIYRAKYYPTGDILSAELGHRPSFVWRSLCESRCIIQRGYRWKIGDGTTTKVWTEPWLKSDTQLRITTPFNPQWPDLHVADLRHPFLAAWNSTLIDQIFTAMDSALIHAIPLDSATGQDQRIWHVSRNGDYTVKSAYRLYMETVVDRTDHHISGKWKELWDLTLPPKILHFLWRLLRDVLPTRGRLRRRGLDISDVCGICGQGYEEDWHLFLECPMVEQGWRSTGMLDRLRTINPAATELRDWIWSCISSQPKDVCHKVLAGFWCIWRERNNRVWNSKTTFIQRVLEDCWAYIGEWKQVSSTKSHQPPTISSPYCVKWHPPPPSRLKCNVDVALFAPQNRTGIGLVIRDELGTIIHYRMQTRPGLLTAKEGEAWSLLEAARWIQGLHLSHVSFEGDSQILMQALQRHDEDLTEYGDIVKNCKALLQDLDNSVYCFVRRARNKVAHTLARQSIFHTTPFVGTVPPSWLADAASIVCRSANH
ncbi:Putative ribonuclease H protein At1g65750 [Linum grandiflorum]